MQISLSHHLYFIPIPLKTHMKSPLLNPKSTKEMVCAPSSFICQALSNPSEDTLQKEPPTPLPSPMPPPSPRLSMFPPDSLQPPKLTLIQKLLNSMLNMVERSVIMKMEKKLRLNRMVDPAVQLEGNFAPVQEFPVRNDLEVVGTIPKTLRGVYVRNGGNPLFPPTSGHHLFDGDGMVHVVSLVGENQATYACRFIRTNRLVQEVELGRPVFPKPIGELHGHLGLARLVLFGFRAMVGLIDAARGIGVANVSLIYFNGRLLAMSEDDLPYQIRVTDNGDLETIKRYDFNGQLKDSMIAHPKVDPITGELFTLSYNVLSKPYLQFFKFDPCGNKSSEIAISIQQSTMIHDFAITESYIVLPDHQVVFKLSEMIRDGSPVVHDPKKISRFGILPKNAKNESEIQWIDVPNCFCFHMWNAWEELDGNKDKIVVVINSCMTPVDAMFTSTDDPIVTELTEIRLNLKTGKSTRRVIVSGINLEGGQVNKRRLGMKDRYVYLAITDPWPKSSGMAKVDLTTGHVTKYMYLDKIFGGEPCFVPSDEDEEDEGFLMNFVRDEEKETSELVVLKASNMKEIASVKLPTRVPYGFHGTFVSSQELEKQAFS
ncbi:9-cis-epoxycarotenoid dioxygenase NCED6, chloroplastic [Primulina huaijiensis]|uniref:9-cis-epoxycarotenoid dioxygenase NCED6, chloroplastic n=1 Tax=Primulina huaijiensis TaxID=1492673 RepID=UPI003CC79876